MHLEGQESTPGGREKCSVLMLVQCPELNAVRRTVSTSITLTVHGLSFPADSPCSNLLGMLSGLIPDSQISASSIRGYDWSPSMARLVSSRSGWFPRVPQAQPGEEWLQVDLGIPKNIRGVIIQGARGGDSVTTTESRSFVKKFKVAYSMNGKDWDFIQDPKTMQAKVGTWLHCLEQLQNRIFF